MTKNPDLILNHARQTALPEKTVKDYMDERRLYLTILMRRRDFIGTIVDTAKTVDRN
jgi:hypothetical protein